MPPGQPPAPKNDEDIYDSKPLFQSDWRNARKKNDMFGGEEEGGIFAEQAEKPKRPDQPIVENGLFGGNALKDEGMQERTKSKLDSIFDYDSDDNLQKKIMDRMTGVEPSIV